MPELPGPLSLGQLKKRILLFRDKLDKSFVLKWALEIHQKPFPPPGLPYLSDEPGWKEYIDRKTQTKKTILKQPEPKAEQEQLSGNPNAGVFYGHFEFSVAAATRLLDSEKGQLAVCNPDRLSQVSDRFLLHGDLEPTVAGTGAGAGPLSSHEPLALCNPDRHEALPEEQEGAPGHPHNEGFSEEPASPTSPIHQLVDLGEGRGCVPPDEFRDVYPEGHIFFWPPQTARAVPLLQARVVTIHPPLPPLPPP